MLDEEGQEGGGGEETKEVEAKELEPEIGDEKELELDEDEVRKKGWDENRDASVHVPHEGCYIVLLTASLHSV